MLANMTYTSYNREEVQHGKAMEKKYAVIVDEYRHAADGSYRKANSVL